MRFSSGGACNPQERGKKNSSGACGSSIPFCFACGPLLEKSWARRKGNHVRVAASLRHETPAAAGSMARGSCVLRTQTRHARDGACGRDAPRDVRREHRGSGSPFQLRAA